MLDNSIKASNIIQSLVITAIIFVQNLLPTDLSSPFIVILGFLIAIINMDRIKKSYLKLIWPLIAILVIGTLDIFDHESHNILRDIAFALVPISLIFIGYWLADNREMRRYILKVMVLCAVALALIHLGSIIGHLDLLDSDLMTVKQEVGMTGDLVVLAFVLGTHQYRLGIGNIFPKMMPRFISLFVLFLSFMLSASRTEFLILIVLSLSLLGYMTQLNLGKSISAIIVLALVFFAITITTPDDEVGTFRSKLVKSVTEVTISDYQDHQDINDNWRGFETYRVIETFLSGNTAQYIVGQGFGSLVDLGFTMELAGSKYDFIPVVHNGYAYILIKTGIVGLLLYILFYIKIIINAVSFRKSTNKEQSFLARLLLGCVLSLVLSMYVVGGMAEAHNVEFVLLVGYLTQRIKQLQLEVYE